MTRANVTVISCIYGDSHDGFLADWEWGIARLTTKPETVIVATDRPRRIRHARVKIGACTWKHPQAYHLQLALNHVETEWVWIHDIDDVARPDALDGIDEVEADVWQLGYERSDGLIYRPPDITAEGLLRMTSNPFVAGSCIRTEALRSVGGFPDLALQDWALWRELAHAGATFKSSDRIHFQYRRHNAARGIRELTADHRSIDLAEMREWEEARALTV